MMTLHTLGRGFDQPDNIRRELLLCLDLPPGHFNVVNCPAIDVSTHHSHHGYWFFFPKLYLGSDKIMTWLVPVNFYSRTRFNLRALETTEMEDSAIAAAAITGLRRKPKNGYSTPAAMGIPVKL